MRFIRKELKSPCEIENKKKADVFDRPEALKHVGLLCNEPVACATCSLISHPTTQSQNLMRSAEVPSQSLPCGSISALWKIARTNLDKWHDHVPIARNLLIHGRRVCVVSFAPHN
jgi:hypothetical protein